MIDSFANSSFPLSPLHVPLGQERVLKMLLRLRDDPPRVILVEGGSREERSLVARFWAGALVCAGDDPPCRECVRCQQVGSDLCRDVLFLGEDELLNIEQVRELRAALDHPPEQGKWRVVIFSEAQRMSPAAANGLLKTLEEPLPGNRFALLAPIRHALLPTLVSRSHVFTLGWREKKVLGKDIKEWQERLYSFFQTGQGLFEYTGQKGMMDILLLQEIIASCQQDLLCVFSGEKKGTFVSLWRSKLSLAQLFRIKDMFDQSLLLCRQNVNPGLILDWLAVEIYSMLAGRN